MLIKPIAVNKPMLRAMIIPKLALKTQRPGSQQPAQQGQNQPPPQPQVPAPSIPNSQVSSAPFTSGASASATPYTPQPFIQQPPVQTIPNFTPSPSPTPMVTPSPPTNISPPTPPLSSSNQYIGIFYLPLPLPLFKINFFKFILYSNFLNLYYTLIFLKNF